MQRSNMANRVQMTGVKAMRATARSAYEFLRAIATLIVGGLFSFYTYITGVGTMQSIQNGLFFDAFVLAIMCVVCVGATILFVGLINGVIEDPLID